MRLLAEITAQVDNTIPLWGILTGIVFGVFYLVKMHFELQALKKEMAEIKEMVHELLIPKSNAKHKQTYHS